MVSEMFASGHHYFWVSCLRVSGLLRRSCSEWAKGSGDVAGWRPGQGGEWARQGCSGRGGVQELHGLPRGPCLAFTVPSLRLETCFLEALEAPDFLWMPENGQIGIFGESRSWACLDLASRLTRFLELWAVSSHAHLLPM